MLGLKKILIAVDFSDYSLPTLRFGLAIAADVKAEAAAVVTVINERDVAAVRAAMQFTEELTVEGYIQKQTESRGERIDQMITETGCGTVPVEIYLRVGVPAVEILKAIDDIGADMVVIGTKGRTNVAGMLFGSVAEKVHRRSPVTVISVRGQEHADLVCRLK
ncbi:MAG: universal stress protein [Pseudomonadota bacterium]